MCKFGAFVLYPGWFNDQVCDNPYKDGIEAVGIGAFPLLPNSNNQWLRNFLELQLGGQYHETRADHHYVQEAARISYTGMISARYNNLTLCVTLGANRNKAYLDNFRQGQAQWYHLTLNTTIIKRIQRAAIREVKYCAFIIYDPDAKQRRIKEIYHVDSIQLVKREDITLEQAGAVAKAETLAQEYWLFKLGDAFVIRSSIAVAGSRDFKCRLIDLRELSKVKNWDDLSNHYDFLQLA